MQFLSKTVLKKFIKEEIKGVGFDESYVESAVKKHTFLSIKIFDVTPSQATIIKQTALSCDCDCAVNRGVIDCSINYSNCILSGTLSQIKNVAKKLMHQPFSLSKLADNLFEQLNIQTLPQKSPKIMGILNITLNSFSDGGEFFEIDKAINHAVDMIEEGADVIDIGAQSTKPMAELINTACELERVIPVVAALKSAYPNIEISVDTMNYACAKASIEAGADIINDVSFFNNPEFAKLCSEFDKKLVIMHSRGNSMTMDSLAFYSNLIDDIYQELYEKTQNALSQGLKKENIIVDVGFGFAKTIEQNFELLNRINEFKSLGYPILAGISRKRFLQDVINTKEPKDADIQTLLASSFLIQQNVEYIRVHNCALIKEAKLFWERLNVI